MRVSFGGVPCVPTFASNTVVVCRMGWALGNATVGGAAAVPVNPMTQPLRISPSEDAPWQTFATNVTNFTFVPSLTPNLVFATRTRGSTEGGTRVEFTVTNMVSELQLARAQSCRSGVAEYARRDGWGACLRTCGHG